MFKEISVNRCVDSVYKFRIQLLLFDVTKNNKKKLKAQ